MRKRIHAVTVGDGSIVSCAAQDERVNASSVDRPADALASIDTSVDCLVGASDLSTDDAISMVETVRERRPFLPVVLAGTTGDAAARAIDAGADRCLSAETTPDHLVAVIESEIDDRTTRRRVRNRSHLARQALDTLSDVYFLIDLNGNFLQWNRELNEVTGYDDEEIAELLPLDFIADEDAEAITGAIQQAVEEGAAKQEATLVTKAGERIPYEFRGSGLRDDDGEVIGISGIGRDITERRERERLLEDQAERLSLLNHVNGVIRQVHRVLVRASTRAEVERAVCDNLTDADAYRFAWIGEYDATGGHAEPRGWSGDEDGYLEDRAASDDTDDVTAATAIENGEMEVIQNVAEGGIDDSWRDAALQRGYRSAAAIPLQYRETTYGVLCVYAPRENAFDERERAVLNELGETIGYAISAAERRRALLGDSVTELEIDVSDDGLYFVAASAALDGEVTLEGVGPQSDSGVVEFLRIDTDGSDGVDDLPETPNGELSVLNNREREVAVRYVTDGPSVAADLAEHGGTVVDATATDGTGTVVVAFPSDIDTRAILRAVKRKYDEAELVAQRKRERSVSASNFRAVADEDLTDRQREVIEVAYRSGFFEWPREADAEDLTSSLGISPPTFHEHIRIGERKLLETFFETEPMPGE
jgi:PAS domain S-box-containing protein